jgi:hypothetical protein
MAAKGSGVPQPGSAALADTYEDLDIGVYHKIRGTWIQVATEPVNWKTGGVLKSIATDGIVKGDVNGRLSGGSSAMQMNSPLEFLIKTPDGIEATDFQLVHLHDKSDAREFRTMTGGVFHASGGSSRDQIAFDQTRIAKRTRYTLVGYHRCPARGFTPAIFSASAILSTASPCPRSSLIRCTTSLSPGRVPYGNKASTTSSRVTFFAYLGSSSVQHSSDPFGTGAVRPAYC